ncbi:MAG: glycosyltransferase, partial [Chitinispirillaceae bacterium]|nr:glycosyltransferase [Chitinispirillaceae bacterium]
KTVLLTTSAAPAQTPFSTGEKRPPIGIGFLIAVLRRGGHTVHFVDNYLAPTDLPTADYLKTNRIEYVGIYVNTICLRHSLAMMYRLDYFRRSNQWQGKIIVGGPHTTVAPETIPEFVDFVVQGEGEQAILDIVEERATDRIINHPRTQDLDSLPMPAWDCFVGKPYAWDCNFFPGKPVFSMNTSRGCPFRCGFCSVCSIWGKKYSMFSAERVVEEIEYLRRTYGAEGIYFREDNFTFNKKRLERFCGLLLERQIRIPWVCESRVNTLTRDMVKMMAESGVRGFYFGVESGSQRMLDFMEKDITVEQIRQAFDWCREFNIRAAASIVVGVPTETPDDVRMTQQLLAEIKPALTWFNVFTGIPTSKLYRYTIDNRLYDFIDDRGLVYLRGHDERARQFYGKTWDAFVPVKFDEGGVVAPKISVVMSVYNGEKHLVESVNSVLAQTLPNFEFIIINDGSIDRTDEILRGFDDRRIKIITNESNVGLTASLIRGAAAARGAYVARMDCGDLSLPHRLETQLRFLESNPGHAVVGSSFYQISDDGMPLAMVPVLLLHEQINEGLLKQNWFCHGSTLIRKDAFAAVGGYDQSFRFSQDYDLWLRMSERYQVANIGEPLYTWRKSADGISYVKKDEQAECAHRAREGARARRASIQVTEQPLVSVIVPTHNRPQLLGRTLQSILNQTYPHYEIIVVNDCGNPVEGIAYGLNGANKIVYIRHKKNAGLAAARNTGIRMATGKYISYLDDDDIFYPDHLETLVGFLHKERQQVAYSDAYMANQYLVNGLWETKERELVYSNDFNYDQILVRNLFPVLCIVHEKQCIDAVGGFDETYSVHEDWDLWIRMSRKYTMHHIRKTTGEFSMRKGGGADQMTTGSFAPFRETRKRIFEKYRALVADRPDIQT